MGSPTSRSEDGSRPAPGQGILAWTLVLGLAAGGCGLSEPLVWIYVDNAEAAPLGVAVDREPPVSVPGKGVGVVKVDPGARRIVVKRGEVVLLDESKEFPRSQGVQKHVLNPDRTSRYAVEIVRYDRRDMPAPSFSLGTSVSDALRSAAVVKGEPWVAGAFDDVFDEKPPQTVQMARGSLTPRRRRLCRIAPADYETVRAAKAAALEAQQAKPDALPDVSPEAVAALQRVLAACP